MILDPKAAEIEGHASNVAYLENGVKIMQVLLLIGLHKNDLYTNFNDPKTNAGYVPQIGSSNVSYLRNSSRY